MSYLATMLGKSINVLLHSMFWLASVFIINSFEDIEIGYFSTPNNNLLWPLIIGAFFNMIVFYASVFWLIPNYFNQQQRKKFYLFIAVLILSCTIFESLFEAAYAFHLDLPEAGTSVIAAMISLDLNIILTLVVHIFFFVVAFGYRYPIDRRAQEQREREMERQQLNSELKYLKAQMDPHTLFNGINSIYHLIDVDGEKAKSILLKFSNLMRYQLYECEEDFVNIAQEISYLKNYIDLNLVRKEEDALIKVTLEDDFENCKIAPLVFTPFVENAFKYLSSHSAREKNKLNIELKREGGQLRFMVSNTFDLEVDEHKKTGGIGLENVQSRLDLIYGKKYELEYGPQNDVFRVQLKLPTEPLDL